MPSTTLSTTPAKSSRRWCTRQIEKNSPATASPYRMNPGSSVISGAQGSPSRASACRPPQIRDSAGAMKNPVNGAEYSSRSPTLRLA
jgi:hypothetical protein